MIKIVTAKNMAECDRQASVSLVTLVERAGEALCNQIQSLGLSDRGKIEFAPLLFGKGARSETENGVQDKVLGKRVAIFCGGGNNGADGYALSGCLVKAGFLVTIIQVVLPQSTACQVARENVPAEVIVLSFDTFVARGRNSDESIGDGGAEDKVPCISAFDLVVDCILGTGLCRAIEGNILSAIRVLNQMQGFKLACDIPSGLMADTGKVLGECVRADMTVTFQCYKYGQLFGDGRDYTGKMVCVDIGIPVVTAFDSAFEDNDVARCFPHRKRNTHKGSYGRVTLIAGSANYFGAGVIAESGAAALRSGCGYATLAVPQSLMPEYRSRITESTLYALSDRGGKVVFQYIEMQELLERSDAIVIGMGLDCSLEVYKCIQYLLQNFEGQLVVDADGLNALGKFGCNILKYKKCAVYLTPHVMELSRLSKKTVAEIVENPIDCAKMFAREYEVNLLLKGMTTIVTDGENVLLNLTGTPALAKAGSGDVLSGILGALLTREKGLTALASAAYVHGRAGELASEKKGEHSVLARDVSANVPNAVLSIVKNIL